MIIKPVSMAGFFVCSLIELRYQYAPITDKMSNESAVVAFNVPALAETPMEVRLLKRNPIQ